MGHLPRIHNKASQELTGLSWRLPALLVFLGRSLQVSTAVNLGSGEQGSLLAGCARPVDLGLVCLVSGVSSHCRRSRLILDVRLDDDPRRSGHEGRPRSFGREARERERKTGGAIAEGTGARRFT